MFNIYYEQYVVVPTNLDIDFSQKHSLSTLVNPKSINTSLLNVLLYIKLAGFISR
jgi:hypothetical protein